MSRAEPYIPAFDGLRALSIAAVFGYHAFNGHRVYGAWAPIRLGYLGVEAFFVLSGFLITLRLLALAKNQSLAPSKRWRIFFLRRAARIFPLYYATLIGLLLFGARLHFPVAPEAWPWFFGYSVNLLIFWRASFVGGGSHFWSLCVEEQFYLVFPLLVLSRARRWLPHVVAVAFVAALVLRVGVASTPSFSRGPWLFALTPTHFDTLGAGIAAALCAQEGHFLRARALFFYLAGIVAAAFFVAAVLVSQGSPMVLATLPTFLGVALAGLLLALWRGELRVPARVLAFLPLAYLGRISYGVYVFHLYFLVSLWGYRIDWLPPLALVRGAIAFVLSIGLAALSWRFFERPILQRARELTQIETDTVSASATTLGSTTRR